ncbi:MAG: flagellar hook-basal body complex protein [Henriciella sp.]|nr:flagellar hook-basal body complex protein [Henriciella sp.]
MSNAIYATLTRQNGLMQEMQVVANNLANSSTTGYKADRAIFAEFLASTGPKTPSISMGGLAAHTFNFDEGGLKFTNGQFDLAIQGDGFFVIETAQGQRLTRAGHFQLSAESILVNANGDSVLGAGGGAITIPEDATNIQISGDGTISVNGELIDRVSIVTANGPVLRDSNTQFSAPDGFTETQTATVTQGALEQSNVTPVLEVARMIEVQRAYEAGQALLEREDKRITQLITALRER